MPKTYLQKILITCTTVFTMALASGAALAQPDFKHISAEAKRLDQLHSLVVNQHGEQIFAQAFRGPTLDTPVNIKSVSKTIVALLTGIAIDRGIIDGTDQRVLPLLGKPAFGDDRDNLTIEHLLTMQTGLTSTSGQNYGAWVHSDNWVDYALNQPLVDDVGVRFIYSTGGWHILGAALTQASGHSLHHLAQAWLGKPLNIVIPPWVTDPQGRYMGGNEMAMSPLGLARIGDMVLNGGMMDGEQVVSSDWLEQSWQPLGLSPFSNDYYGYGWFLAEYANEKAVYARGYGGQMLAIVPELNLTIVVTSDPTLPARSEGHFGDLEQLLSKIVNTIKST